MGSIGHRGADACVRTIAKEETSVPSQLCHELKTSKKKLKLKKKTHNTLLFSKK